MISEDKYNKLKINLESIGLQTLTKIDEIDNLNSFITITDGRYKLSVKCKKYIKNTFNSPRSWFLTKDPYIIDNINKYLELRFHGDFICISSKDDLIDRESLLLFMCTRCKTIIKKSIHNLLKDDLTHHGLRCPNCDETLESMHALVLKQIFKYYYPDSIEEDPSCINPNTNYVMPTDIVNHRLKIAIEVQGQWHKHEDQKQRDRIKKDYWINKGYTFYDYEIDGVSVLEYIRYFFPDIQEIPSWVNMKYNKKLNLVEIQDLLNSGEKIQSIADKLDINVHRIYDALQENKLYYPDKYIKSTRRPVVMLDIHRNYIKTYGSYADAERDNNITPGLILSCIYYKRYFSSGYYWIPEDLYKNGNYIIPENRTEKFYVPVNKINIQTGDVINTFSNMYEAGKDIGVIASKIYTVASGKKKTVNGFHYEFA